MILAGRYELTRLIGRGGMGQVWEGRDPVLGRRVAVKTVHLGPSADPTVADRFRREAVATAALSHPDIVTVYDAGVEEAGSAGSTAFMVMEFVDGPDLARAVRERGPLLLAEALRVGEHVAGVLAAAHAIGVVHRDVKPANVLLAGTGVKVVDFGIAALTKSAEPTLTAPGTTLGTAEYISPEQAMAMQVTPAADVYSLGCLLVALLTGQPPFTGAHPVAILRQHVEAAPPRLTERLPDAPPGLELLVAAMLAKDPRTRPDAHRVHDTLAGLRRAGATAPGAVAGVSDDPTAAPPTLPATLAQPLVVTGAAEATVAPTKPDRRVVTARRGTAATSAEPNRYGWKALPILVGAIAAVALVVVGLGAVKPPAPEPAPASPTAVVTTEVGSSSVTPSPTPQATTPAPAPAPEAQGTSATMAALRAAIESLDSGARESATARQDLLRRWQNLAKAVDAGREGKVLGRIRGIDRRVDALAREDAINPAQAAALHEALDAVSAAVQTAS